MKHIHIKCKGNRYLSYSQLKTFQGNLKEMSKINVEKLKQSILIHGWIAPIFVWNNDYILDGHGRLLVLSLLLKEGYTIGDLPVVDVEAQTKKEAAQILLAINSNYQTITDDGLYEFMNEMEINFKELEMFELPDIDMERFGAEFFEKKGLTEDDNIPDVPEKPKTKLGDLYFLGSHRLLCGDATKKEDVERLMDGKKADMVFTDPPYGVSYADKNKYLNAIARGNRIQTPIENDHKTIDDIRDSIIYPSFCNLRFTLKNDGVYYITSPQYGDLLMMMMMMIEKSGLKLRHMLIWVKNNHVLGRTDYNYKHEPIFYGWNEKHHYYGNGEHQFSTWEINKPHKSDLHPTMKPVALIVNALQNSTQRDELCLDFFLGSGSTLIACEKTNRICYGMEIDPHYCDVIVQRYIDFTGNNKIIKNGLEYEEKQR